MEYRKEGGGVVVNVGGVGYAVHMTHPAAMGLVVGHKIRIFTHMSLKEDSATLFGFVTQEELEMFTILIGVSGVGPKAALGLLSVLKPSELVMAIVAEDSQALAKAPGVGKRTAARISLELKEKLLGFDTGNQAQLELPKSESPNIRQDAIDALLALGYTRAQALKAVMQAAAPGMDTSAIVKSALRKLNK